MVSAAVACPKEAGTTARAERWGVRRISFREPREAGLAYERKHVCCAVLAPGPQP